MAFALPPLTLPPDIIAKQDLIQKGPGIDAAFFTQILSISNGAGLYTNPFNDALGGLSTITDQVQALAGPASAVGASAPLDAIGACIKEMTTVFSNIATNIVPTPLPMGPVLSAAVESASGSIPGVNPNDAACLAPFTKAIGVPQLGQILSISTSQYVLNTQCGTVDPANPMPMLNHFSSMLTDMTAGATAFVGSVSSTVTNLFSVPSIDLADAINSAKTSVEGVMGSSFGAPIAGFGAKMFSTVKDQMATGLATSMRQMVETNYASKFMITGLGSSAGGSFGGILGGGVGDAIKNHPSNINLGNIIP